MKKRIKRKKMGGKILKNQAPVRPKNMFVEKRFIKKINCWVIKGPPQYSENVNRISAPTRNNDQIFGGKRYGRKNKGCRDFPRKQIRSHYEWGYPHTAAASVTLSFPSLPSARSRLCAAPLRRYFIYLQQPSVIDKLLINLVRIHGFLAKKKYARNSRFTCKVTVPKKCIGKSA